jgi:uncharacterized membrane protein
VAQAAQPTGDAHSPRARRRHVLDTTYELSLALKGIDGVLETIGGVLLLVISPASLDAVVRHLFQHELSTDRNDFIARHLVHVAANLHSTQTFGAIYLLSHGIAKLIMVGGLVKRQRWAYPFAVIFLAGFIAYQLYRMTFAPSFGLVFLTVFDAVVLWLVVRDDREHRAAARAGTPRSPAEQSPGPTTGGTAR